MLSKLAAVSTRLDRAGYYNAADELDNFITLAGALLSKFSKNNAFDEIKKYVGKPNVFLQFSEVNKLGINPTFPHGNMFGIYGYPLTPEVYSQLLNAELPFAQNRKYIIVFEITPGPVDIMTIGQADIERLTPVVRNAFTDKLTLDYLDKVIKDTALPAVEKFVKLLRFFDTPTKMSNALGQIGISGLLDNGHGIVSPGENIHEGFAISSRFTRLLEVLLNPSPATSTNIINYVGRYIDNPKKTNRADAEKKLNAIIARTDADILLTVIEKPISTKARARLFRQLFEHPSEQLTASQIAAFLISNHPETLEVIVQDRKYKNLFFGALAEGFASAGVHPAETIYKLLPVLIKNNALLAIDALLDTPPGSYAARPLAEYVAANPDIANSDKRWGNIITKIYFTLKRDGYQYTSDKAEKAMQILKSLNGGRQLDMDDD